jgi:predicted dehydrogenase
MPIKIALVGIGGYGAWYLQELLQIASERDARLVAAIDPVPHHSPLYAECLQAGIPIFTDLASFYQHDTADLVILSVPIQYHAPLTCLALSKGSHVLCEKPLGATLDDALAMQAAQQQSGKLVAIGYQWSFSDAALALKRDILSGRLGRPLGAKTLLLWQRARSYYQRSDWAGRIRTDTGAWVLDSPVNNATAHYLHHMLFLLGDTLASSARPNAVQAELYRANPIENYDTAALRVETASGADLLFLTTHAVLGNRGPRMQFEFEDARVAYSEALPEFRVTFRDGRVENYGRPEASETNKLWNTVTAIREGDLPVCGIQTALPHLLCVAGAQQTPISCFPQASIRIEVAGGDPTTWVDGLAETFSACYQSNRLPSQLDVEQRPAWATPATHIDLSSYARLFE